MGLSEKYIKRTLKGKGRKKKDFVKEVEKFRNSLKPQISIALSLMIMKDINKKEQEKKSA